MPSRPRFSRLDLRWRFLLVLLPVTLGATVGTGLVARHLLFESYARQARTSALARLQSTVLPLGTRLHALEQGLGRLADRAPVGMQAEQDASSSPSGLPWQHEVGSFLEQWVEVDEVYCVQAEIEGARLTRIDRDRLHSALLPLAELPIWARTEASTRTGEPATDGAERRARWHLAEESGMPVSWMTRPLRGARGSIGVVLRADVIAARFESLQNAVEDGRVVLFDLRGNQWHPLPSTTSTPFEVGQVLSSEVRGSRGDFPDLRGVEDATEFFAVRHADPDLGLVVAHLIPRSHLDGELARLDRLMFALVLVAFVLSATVITLLTRRVVIPIERLTRTMGEVARGDLGQRLPVTGEDEIAQLSRSFNSMISDLHTTHVALKEQSRRLSEALHEVEDVEAMKDSFLALVSHEVRTPLTSIMGGVEFLREEFGEQHDEIQTEFMGIVYDSARRLAGFMNDAIMMASLQASRSRSSFESFSVTALLHSKFDEIVAPAAARGLVVENRMDSQREFLVHGDWTLLQVALDKVLHNAVRHNRAEGSVVVEVVDRIVEDDEGDLARDMDARNGELSDPQMVWRAIRIFNTGPLIAPERIETLFARFELTHDISNHQRGSGLSLPIANYILGYHGGCIEVRPVADEGMAFYLVLPGRLSIQSRVPSSVPLPDDIDDTVTTAHIVRAAADEVERLEAGIAAAESEDRRRRHARGEVVSGPVDVVEVECESIGPGPR